MSLKSFLKAAEKIKEQRSPYDADKAVPDHHDDSNWLVSYADMMTLLCAFFIMLFSMAKLDAPKFEEVKKAMVEQFGGQYQSPHENLGKYVSQIIQEAGVAKETTVRVDPRGVSIAFESTLFFDTLSAEVKPEGQAVLGKVIAALEARQKQDLVHYKIVVEGHTDSRPVVSGIFPTNWELSSARASRVVRYFIEKGFEPEKLAAIGYADTRPAVPTRTPAGAMDENAFSKNRRVVLRIFDSALDSPPEGTTNAANYMTHEIAGPLPPEQFGPH
jgi:chemotaxis protein MotB